MTRKPLLLFLCIMVLIVLIPNSEAALSDGVVSYWNFSGNSNDIRDIYNNDGSDTDITYHTSCPLGGCASWNGATSIIDLADTGFPDGTDNMTIMILTNSSRAAQNDYLTYGTSDTNQRFGLIKNTANVSFIGKFGSADWNTGIVIEPRAFIQMVYTRNTTHESMWFNGTQRATRAAAGSIVLSGAAVFGGIFATPRMGGFIDDIGIWNRTLSPSEISELYNDGDFLGYPFSVPPSASVEILYPTDGLTLAIQDVDLNFSASGTFDSCFFVLDNNQPNSTICPGGVPTNITLEGLSEGAHNITVVVNDSSGNISSDTNSFTIDITFPTITVNPSNFHKQDNQSNTNQYTGNSTINYTFFDDRDLFGYLINISRGSSTLFHILNESLSGSQNVTTTLDLNTSAFSHGVVDVEVQTSDSHTKNKIKDYDIFQFGNKIRFDTAEGNDVSISSPYAYDTDYIKTKDRYTFVFDYITKKNSRTYYIESSRKIKYLEDSGYVGHFVVWNDQTKKGNWIDFEGQGSDVTITKISDYKYQVDVSFDKEKNKVEFNSIGGLNVITANFNWYKGAVTNTFNSVGSGGLTETYELNVTIATGYVDSVTASLVYNGTVRTVTKDATSEQFSLFTSSFTAPEVSGNLDGFWYVNITQNDSSTYNFTVAFSQELLLASVEIAILDEQNQTFITENVTIFLTLEQSRTAQTDNGTITLSNLTVGDYFIEGESLTYPRRGVLKTLDNQTNSLTLYLLQDQTGNENIDFFLKLRDQENLEDADMTFQRTINGSLITVAQGTTDFAGQLRVFLDTTHEYRIIINKAGVVNKILTLRPILNEYTIFVDTVQQSLYNNVWEGLRYTLIPKSRLINVTDGTTEIALDIFADDSSLEWFGVFVDLHNYTCDPVSCLVNITSSASGGRASLTLLGNETGTFDVHYFFKRSGFDTQYIHGSLYGFIIFQTIFGENIATWLDDLTTNLGGDTNSKIMLSVLAAVGTTVAVVLASQMGIVGVGLVLVAVLGNIFFMLAGFITIIVGIIITVIGLSVYLVLGREE